VIFKIASAGDSFEVFVKDSAVENGKILAKYGPFFCS
jgi:hypothetical protein